MTNGEKYKDKILKMCEDEIDFAVCKDTEEIVDCRDLDCMNCLFENESCSRGIIKWSLSEYKEKEKEKVLDKVLNVDKYKEEILNAKDECGYFAVERNTNKITICDNIRCRDCYFHETDGSTCSELMNKWLLSEYKEIQESIELTQQEYDFLCLVGTGYLAKNGVNVLYFYKSKPTLNSGNVILKWEGNRIDVLSLFDNLKNSRFAFIKPDDTEPWSVEKILDNCVVREGTKTENKEDK